jgi:hypothetical protein
LVNDAALLTLDKKLNSIAEQMQRTADLSCNRSSRIPFANRVSQ